MTAWTGQVIGPLPMMLQWVITVGIYPLAAWLFIRVQKGLLSHV
jgi:hypothetical protein